MHRRPHREDGVLNRNLITRMGTASGVVAALVAAVFAVLVTAVRDQRSSTEAARVSQQVISAATEVRHDLIALDLARRGGPGTAPDVRRIGTELTARLTTLPGLVRGDPAQERRVALIARDPEGRSTPETVRQLISAEQANVYRRARDAANKAHLAIGLGIFGLVGSALLIALLTTYLAAYIVDPLRRTARAARRLATGDLSARVPEVGDTEPVELARSFNAMADSLQEAERLKDEFFALVSHELRTPLTSIIGYLELVLDDEANLSAESRHFLEVVDRNAKRLLRLVGDMLFIAQVEAGRLTLETGPVRLDVVTAEAVEAARPAAVRAGITMTLESAEVRELTGDHDRFGQMLDNLVSNALKFTPDGGSVAVRLHDRAEHAELEVSDTGTGVSAEDQEHIFERFFRASSATNRAIPGAGLGLAIVRTIVEAHGGTVSLTSREGKGTSVLVRLPYQHTEPAP